MHTLTRRIRHASEDDRDVVLHPRFSYATVAWVGAGIAGAGLLTNLYGANKQSKDNARTQDLNAQQIREADLNQWKSYLIQRGLNPTGVTQFGAVPTNAPAMNTRLPLWATMPTAERGGATGKGFRGLSIPRTT